MKILKLIKKTLSGIVIVLILTSCNSTPPEKTSILMDGSSTVYPIANIAVTEFKNTKGQEVDIKVNISGTGGGFKKFCAGETDINNASRPINKEEMASCNQGGVSYIELPIAFDALTVAVNPNNTWLDSITTEQLKTIWQPSAQGNITRWNQIDPNFPAQPLNLFGADKKSGTFDYFTEAIMGVAGASREDFVANEDDDLTVQGLIQDPNSMGYFGLSYYQKNSDKLKALSIDNGNGAISPTIENVVANTYQPLARPLLIYVNLKSAQEKKDLQDFMDFFLKNTAKFVSAVNYIPLTDESYHINFVTFNKGEAGTVFGGKSDFNLSIPELQRKQAQLKLEN